MKPPFQYFGSKQTVAGQIRDLFLPHDHYVEPFAGSLAVLLAKTPAKLETVNDINGEIVNFWRIVRDFPEEFERQCLLTPFSRTEYEMAKDVQGCTDMERARRFWIRVEQGFAHTGSKTGWRFCYQGNNNNLDSRVWNHARRIPAVAGRIRNVQLENREAIDLIRDAGRYPGVLIYADPPYLGQVRETGQYVHEMQAEAEHRELADALADCKAMVALSGYDSDLYRELYRDWHRHEIVTQTGTARQGERFRTEILWVNYQPDLGLFTPE
jgi:DNA adenine methylase